MGAKHFPLNRERGRNESPWRHGTIDNLQDYNPFGILKSPTISVDGNVKGGCLFRSALFVNLEPGKHRVSLDTANFEVEIKTNQKIYASCIPWMLDFVDAETGAAKIEGLSYQGTYWG